MRASSSKVKAKLGTVLIEPAQGLSRYFKTPGSGSVSRYLHLRIDNWRLAFGCASSYSLSVVALLSSELMFVFIDRF
jgi:hypothetical protein